MEDQPTMRQRIGHEAKFCDAPSIGEDLWRQLKRIQLPVFSGDKMDYRNWKAAFMACVDTAPATGEYKLLQLRQCLSGEALSVIENLGHSASVRLFADDCDLYRNINSLTDCQILQEDLNSLAQWETDWQMKFNVAKCHSMRVTRHLPSNQIHFNYSLHQQTLEQVRSAKYLGLTITDDLEWGQHISEISCKATETLGFLRRNLALAPRHTKEVAYKTLVRPQLEYAAPMWHPYNETEKKRWRKCR